MLNEPRTTPSCSTMRGCGGSCDTVVAEVSGIIGIPGMEVVGAVPAVVAPAPGASVGGAATVGISVTVVVVAGVTGSGVGVGFAVTVAPAPPSSCFKYCAATNAYAFAGAWICVHSPFVSTVCTASPL